MFSTCSVGKFIFAVCVAVCLSAAVSITTFAQEITGSIAGRVTDKSGATVAAATVTVINTDKNDVVVRALTTNDVGEYVASVLPIGHYAVVAEAKGFKKAERRGITLNVNDNLTLNLELAPGDISDTVTVEADASPSNYRPPLNPASSPAHRFAS